MTQDTGEIMLVGGPYDGTVIGTADQAVIELERDGLIHRYVTTSKRREQEGRSYAAFNYDGTIDPNGSQPGIETPDGGHHTPLNRE
jgi:hypothetical protein